jgi:hypothetical protein
MMSNELYGKYRTKTAQGKAWNEVALHAIWEKICSLTLHFLHREIILHHFRFLLLPSPYDQAEHIKNVSDLRTISN